MQEFYFDKKGNKRRLRFKVGDFIIVKREDLKDKCNIYQIVKKNYEDIKLVCPFCTKDVVVGFEDKQELKSFILDKWIIKEIISKRDFYKFTQEKSEQNIIFD
jgi:phosphotransferase system IIB component